MTCHLKNQNTFAMFSPVDLTFHVPYRRTVGLYAYLRRAVVKLQRQKQLQARLPEPARIDASDSSKANWTFGQGQNPPDGTLKQLVNGGLFPKNLVVS